MNLYLSEDLLKLACNGFKRLNSGNVVKQGVTQDVSAIRHCLALDSLLKTHSLESAKLQHKTDPFLKDFIRCVGDVVRLSDNSEYTTNLINDIKSKSDFGVGSNLISAGVATHSVSSIQTYPKKADKGLISIDNYNFSLKTDYIDKLKNTYRFSTLEFSFLIWLNRFESFDLAANNGGELFECLVSNIKRKYSTELTDLICFADKEHFQGFIDGAEKLLSESKPNLITLFDSDTNQNSQSSEKQLSGLLQIPKPFLLLAGISGTGKTRFVRQQASFTGSIDSSYCLTSVRPDWHEPSDLLGYVSRLGQTKSYVVTDVLKFIVNAWVELHEAGVVVKNKKSSGTLDNLDNIRPFWLCLDEMNLAPVEQYFADYLSVLETREWIWDVENFKYTCDPLLKSSVFEEVDRDKLRKELDLAEYDELWAQFLEHGIGIPLNLIIAGTVNMDETTHGFSRKVIDRALTLDFGEFFPNDFDAFFKPNTEPKALTYPLYTDGRNINALNGIDDKFVDNTLQFLTQVNQVLDKTPFKLAYRSLNELFLSVISQRPQTEIELQAVWDDFLMCKVLPRIEGDFDKLTKGSGSITILDSLNEVLRESLKLIWDTTTRPDLFRNSLVDENDISIKCRSKTKIEWMNEQLKNGFTSFWP